MAFAQGTPLLSTALAVACSSFLSTSALATSAGNDSTSTDKDQPAVVAPEPNILTSDDLDFRIFWKNSLGLETRDSSSR